MQAHLFVGKADWIFLMLVIITLMMQGIAGKSPAAGCATLGGRTSTEESAVYDIKRLCHNSVRMLCREQNN